MKKRATSKHLKMHQIPKLNLNWRMTWYSVLIWFLSLAVGGFVIAPWFYLALPVTILWLTIFYFKNSKIDNLVRGGLWVSLFWFFVIVTLDFFEIIGPYYANASLYFSDFRNWWKYPLILLTPLIYSLILDGLNLKKGKVGRIRSTSSKRLQFG